MSRANTNPDIHRKFQFTSLGSNSNKMWEILAWKTGRGEYEVETRYCRTGNTPQTSSRTMSLRRLNGLIGRKIKKGYREVGIPSGTASIDDASEEGRFASVVLRAANEHISTYFKGDANAVSGDQIREGRRILDQISFVNPDDTSLLVSLAEQYYRVIPTKLPHRIDPEEVARDLVSDLHKQEERLDQLEAVVCQRDATTKKTDLESVLGCKIEYVSGGQEHSRVADMVLSSIEHYRWRSIKLRRMFRVTIPDERKRFINANQDIDAHPMLFHGTQSRNVRHIMRSGLIIPAHAANGSMFGRGIYLADRSSKSLGYTGGTFRALFIVHAALGKQYEADDAMKHLRAAPEGYQSVVGVAGHTKSYSGHLSYNEYVVYQRERVTVRYIVEVEE